MLSHQATHTDGLHDVNIAVVDICWCGVGVLLADDTTTTEQSLSRIEAYATLRKPSRTRSHTAPPTPDHLHASSVRTPTDQTPSRTSPDSPKQPMLQEEANATTPLAGHGILASPSTPRIKPRSRSATVPEVLPPGGGRGGSMGTSHRESGDLDLQKMDYSRTMYLQESCVWLGDWLAIH